MDLATGALLVAAISLTISWLTYFRDKPNAKVIIFKEAIFTGMDLDTKFTSINVTNVGRRPLTLLAVGYRKLGLSPKSKLLTHIGPLPKRLEEGEDIAYLYKRSAILEKGSWKGVAYVFVADTTGKEYRFNIAPFYLVWPQRLYERLTRPIRRTVFYFKHLRDD